MTELCVVFAILIGPAVVFPVLGALLAARLRPTWGRLAVVPALGVPLLGPLGLHLALGALTDPCTPPESLACGEGAFYDLVLMVLQSVVGVGLAGLAWLVGRPTAVAPRSGPAAAGHDPSPAGRGDPDREPDPTRP